jgi:tyrosinase
VSAAQDFRLPYWDWSLLPTGGNAFPASVAGPSEIQVVGIDGKPQRIPNPLQHYNFNVKNLGSGDFPDPPVSLIILPLVSSLTRFQFNKWAVTHRYPQDQAPNTVSQDNLVNPAVKAQNTSIRSQIRYCMGSISDFGAFSNDKWIKNQPGSYPSLEDIHDNIHVLVGGPGPRSRGAPPGNMSLVPHAGFDPVFWLHHW